MKIHPVGAELFHADGRTDGWTDMTKLIVAFRNFLSNNTHTICINVEELSCNTTLNWIGTCRFWELRTEVYMPPVDGSLSV